MADLATPEDFSADLGASRLRVIGGLMLDTLAKAGAVTNTDLDCAYSRGALAWAWMRNALLQLARSRTHRWLSIRHAGNDLVIGVGQYPVRFFIDDHLKPRKQRVLSPTEGEASQLSLAFETQSDGVPALWRFIVERAASEDDENKVFFVGYDGVGEVVAKWQFTDSVRTFEATDAHIPAAAELEPLVLAPIYAASEVMDVGGDEGSSSASDSSRGDAMEPASIERTEHGG